MTNPCARCAMYDHLRGDVIRREIAKLMREATPGERSERYRKYLADYHDQHVRFGRVAALMVVISEQLGDTTHEPTTPEATSA